MLFCPHKQVQRLMSKKERDAGAVWYGCTHYTDRVCVVSDDLPAQKKLDVTIHESLHAVYPDLNESAVDGAATDIAALLWKIGYRKIEE